MAGHCIPEKNGELFSGANLDSLWTPMCIDVHNRAAITIPIYPSIDSPLPQKFPKMTNRDSHLRFDVSKSQLRYMGTEEEFRSFTKDIVPHDGVTWEEYPKHNLLVLKTKEVVFRWCRGTKTLVVQGPNQTTVKKRLHEIIENNGTWNQEQPSSLEILNTNDQPNNEQSNGPTNDENLTEETDFERIPLLSEVSLDDDSDSDDSDSDDEKEEKSDLSSVREGIEGIKSNLTELCKTLKSPANANNGNHQGKPEECNSLNNEIVKLKAKLKEQESKTKPVEQERDSLLIAISLLSLNCGTVHPDSTTRTQVVDLTSSTRQLEPKRKMKKKQPPKKKKEHQVENSNHANQTPMNKEQPKTSVLIGDSMIKNIQGWNVGKEVGHRFLVKAFSGATTTDMMDYIKPTINQNPTEVIIHCGTNDLKSKEP